MTFAYSILELELNFKGYINSSTNLCEYHNLYEYYNMDKDINNEYNQSIMFYKLL